MPVKRATMKFFVPISIAGISSDTLEGRRSVPCYISPQSIQISEKKLIQETFTKGGYFVEYWGEELPVINVNGTTGSGGIEAVEILRAVYRNEQFQMNQVLRERAREEREAVANARENTSAASIENGIISTIDSLFENGFSEILDGTRSIVDEITSIYDEREDIRSVQLIPNLAAFAVSVDLFMQGYKYRGYFSDFQINETADSPGIFTYSFNFKVLRRSGRRQNFMPWHRRPYDASGNPTEASIPIEGARLDELSYPTSLESSGDVELTRGLSTFRGSQDGGELEEDNNVGINRLKKVQS